MGCRCRAGRCGLVCLRASGRPARGRGHRRDRVAQQGAPCRGCGSAIEWDGGPRGALSERGVARLRPCPWPGLAGPRTVSAQGVDTGSCALHPGRDAAGTIVCHKAGAGPGYARAGLPGGRARHLGDRRQRLGRCEAAADGVGDPSARVCPRGLGQGVCLSGLPATPGAHHPGGVAGGRLDAPQCRCGGQRPPLVGLVLAPMGHAGRTSVAPRALGPAQCA